MTLNETVGEDINAWIRKLNQDIAVLRQAIMLQTSPSDREEREQMRPYFEATAALVDEVERQTSHIRSYIVTGHAQQRRMNALSQRAEAQADRVTRIRAQLPSHMSSALDALLSAPKAEEQAAPEPEPEPEVKRTSIFDGGRSAPREIAKVSTKKPGNQPRVKLGQRRRESPVARDDDVGTPGSSEFPQIAHVTAEELSAAPQYVKGRLTLEKIDRVVDKVNTFLTVKYAILRKKRRDLSSSDMDKWQAFHDNECAETQGEKFVTDVELKEFGDFKMDPTARSSINVLRHIGALKEVRGKNKTRIFIVKEMDN